MANYNEAKIFEQFDKLNPNELYLAWQRLKEWVTKKLTAEQQELQDQSSDLQSKIEKL